MKTLHEAGIKLPVIILDLEAIRIKTMPDKDYKFVDDKIEYMISTSGEIFIQVDPEKDLWAEIHTEDIEFMTKHKGNKSG